MVSDVKFIHFRVLIINHILLYFEAQDFKPYQLVCFFDAIITISLLLGHEPRVEWKYVYEALRILHTYT